jgi:hypothetical protein
LKQLVADLNLQAFCGVVEEGGVSRAASGER